MIKQITPGNVNCLMDWSNLNKFKLQTGRVRGVLHDSQ